MKQIKIGLFLLLGLLITVSPVRTLAQDMPSMMELVEEAGYEVNELDKPKGAALIDANTGKLLWAESPDEQYNPASIIKLMVIYMVYEAIAAGQFTMETEVVADERYEAISSIYILSNNNIQNGVSYPVKELIPMALVPSSNVATLMLAELVDPDAVSFLSKMNEKAQELGMTNTHIVNATGAEISAFDGLYAQDGVDVSNLDISSGNKTTARDLATFTYFLLKYYPEILNYTNQPTITVMADTPYEETFDTYNYSLPSLDYHYEGTDGLKTGSSPSSGFNIVKTVKNGDLRLISVVLGVGNWEDQTGEYKRHPFVNSMSEYGFNNFEYGLILEAGEHEVSGEKISLGTDLMDTYPKVDKPTVSFIEPDSIEVNNKLKPVSPLINPVQETVEVTSINFKKPLLELNKATNYVSSLTLDKNQKIMIVATGLTGVAIVILIISLLVSSNRSRKQKNNYKRRLKTGKRRG